MLSESGVAHLVYENMISAGNDGNSSSIHPRTAKLEQDPTMFSLLLMRRVFCYQYTSAAAKKCNRNVTS